MEGKKVSEHTKTYICREQKVQVEEGKAWLIDLGRVWGKA